MYISDKTADAFVASNQVLQDVVGGKRVVFWLPGYGAGASVPMLLSVGWGGTALALARLLSLERNPGWFLLSAVVVVSVIGVCNVRVLRGFAQARTRMHQLSVALVFVGMIVVSAGIGRFSRVDWVPSGIGLAASIAARYLIAGNFYATLCAFFRARRTFANHAQAELTSIRDRR
jgi:hypothetical protein